MNNLPIALGLSILLFFQYSAHGQICEFSDVDMVTTFNDDFGYGSTEISASPNSFMGRSAIQSDDKVISILNDGGSPAIVRFDQNGGLDESFLTPEWGFFPQPTILLIDEQDRIYFRGATQSNKINRYLPDGQLDDSFEIVLEVFGQIVEFIATKDGGFVGFGTGSGKDRFLIKFTSDGQVDKDFGTDGIFNFTNRFCASTKYEIGEFSDGSLLCQLAIADVDRETIVLYKLSPDGILDSNFGDAGAFLLDILVYKRFRPGGFHIMSDDKVIIGGLAIESDFTLPFAALFLHRITADGQIDLTFGRNEDGYSITGLPDYFSGAGFQPHYIANPGFVVDEEANRVYFNGTYVNRNPGFGIAALLIEQEDSDLLLGGDLDLAYGNRGYAFGEMKDLSLVDPQMLINSDGDVIQVGVSENRDFRELVIAKFNGRRPTSNTNDENILDYQFATFPNPAKNQTTLNFHLDQSEKVSIRLQNINGQTLQSFVSNQRLSGGNQQVQLDLTNEYPTGLYLLNIDIGEKRIVQKLMIE